MKSKELRQIIEDKANATIFMYASGVNMEFIDACIYADEQYILDNCRGNQVLANRLMEEYNYMLSNNVLKAFLVR